MNSIWRLAAGMLWGVWVQVEWLLGSKVMMESLEDG